jgi:hypothetical protein
MSGGRSLYRAATETAITLVMAAAAVALTSGQTAGALPTGAEVLSRHVEAIGGAEAFKAVRSFHAKGRFEIAGTGVVGDVDLFASRPNKVLLRVTLAAVGVVEGAYNGTVGWSVDPIAGPEVLSGRRLEEMAEESFFDATLHESSYVKPVEPVERVTFDGQPAFKVKVVFASGREAVEYFDVQTGLLMGVEAERASPQGIVPTVSLMRDYRPFGRAKQPTTIVQRALGLEQVLTVTSFEIDTVPDAVFTPPPSIAALLKR